MLRVLVAPVLLLASCAYARDRAADLGDIVDLKYGAGGMGFGLKVRATELLGTGIGWWSGDSHVETVGRQSDRYPYSEFFGVAILAGEIELNWEWCVLGLRFSDLPRKRPLAIFRFGGEILLPGVRCGMFLNFGEFLDFLVGFATLDIAGDDGPAPPRTEPPPADKPATSRQADP